jgi:hypothetical protein
MSSSLVEEEKQPEASEYMKKFLSKIEKMNPLDNTLGFMNQLTGTASVIIHCKHYSHLECLRKYYTQQNSNHYQMQVNGFNFNEFACPVCKSINNSLMPSYPIDQVYQDEDQIGAFQHKQLVDFYVDFFSEIIKNRIGERFEAIEAKQVLLKDMIEQPGEFISNVVDHMTHTIFLTDIKGL